MTFQECVNEMAVYEFSSEFYNLVKESAELTVYGRLIENQRFNGDNLALVESFNSLIDGYFSESVTDEKLQLIEEKFMDKAKEIWDKIWNKLKEAWKAFCNFIARLFHLTDAQGKQVNEVVKAINNAAGNIDDIKLSKLFDTLKAKNDGFRSIDVSKKSDGGNKNSTLNNDFLVKVSNSKHGSEGFKHMVINGLAKEHMVVVPKVGASGARAVSIDAIKKAVKEFCRIKDEAGVKALASSLEIAMQNAAENGITVPVSNAELDKVQEDLGKYKIEAEKRDKEYIAGTNSANAIAGLNTLNATLIKTISAIINMLNESFQYRKYVSEVAPKVLYGNPEDKPETRMSNAEVSD